MKLIFLSKIRIEDLNLKVCKTFLGQLRSKGIVIFIICFASFLILGNQALNALHPSLKTEKWFTQIPLRIEDEGSAEWNRWFNLFDMGVVDINHDNLLDVFTLHHSAPQALLISDGNGHFKNRLSALKLSQNPEFPGFEIIDSEPLGLNDPPGLYISRTNAITLRGHNISDEESISGNIEFPYPITIKQEDSFDTRITKKNSPDGLSQTDLKFTASRGGVLEIAPSEAIFSNTPVSVHLDSQLSLSDVYIGANRVQPRFHNFDLFLRDRHGMAWADYNGDAQIDLFITRGGMRGRLSDYLGIVNDELLLNRGDTFEDQTGLSGITKEGCPGRQTAPVDFNNDGLLDIYIACGRGGAADRPGSAYPNQLYQQQIDGFFIDVAQETGLDIPEKGSFVWTDADGDQDMDLFWQDAQAFWLYVNESGDFKPRLIGDNPAKTLSKLAIADYDADGDLDIFAASDSKNTLVISADGNYRLVDPESSGLPAKSITANWVDYDSDGRVDLHAVPNGLYRQLQDHRFESIHLLESEPFNSVAEARCTWFDADNDGARDLVLAARYHIPRWAKLLRLGNFSHPQDWTLTLYRNSRVPHHWLQVELIGTEGNHQAIGARIVVETSNGQQQMQQIGQAEGSLHSMGHYRLYFGIGKKSKIISLKVLWPDGYLQEIVTPASDQLLVIQRTPDSV